MSFSNTLILMGLVLTPGALTFGIKAVIVLALGLVAIFLFLWVLVKIDEVCKAISRFWNN